MENKFYNAEQKQAFIISYATKKDENGNPLVDPKNSSDYIYTHDHYIKSRAIFNKIGEIETRYNKDFCDIVLGTDQKMIDDIYLKCFVGKVEYTNRISTSVLRKYLAWCYDNGYISLNNYRKHPFYKTITSDVHRCPKNHFKSTEINGVRGKNTVNAVKNADFRNIDYVFKREDNFFEYIRELFFGEAFVMQAACCCLLYYGFENEKILNIKRDEVIEKNHSVCQRIIDNPVAFELILRAKYASFFVTKKEGKDVKRCYSDTSYLLRSANKSKGDAPVSAPFFHRVYAKEDEAAKLLPDDSKYKEIRVKLNTIKKLRTFHRIVKDAEQYGEDYVITNIKNGEYGNDIDYTTYLTMLARSDEL